MREIKFRGKAVQDLPNAEIKKGDWIHGYYVLSRGHHYILPVHDAQTGFDERWFNWIEVDPETVGQYTGLQDKNGKGIYEGDIFRNHASFYVIEYVVVQPGFIGCEIVDKKKTEDYNSHLWYCQDSMEVIGNLADNPELLENNHD